jgi:phage terminase Nu1 subunit (DNA packaging protein)
MAKKQPPSKPTTARTRDEVARILEVHTRTVAEWIAMGCPGKGADGLYRISEIENWREAYRRMVEARTQRRLAEQLERTRERHRQKRLSRQRRHAAFMAEQNRRLGLR